MCIYIFFIKFNFSFYYFARPHKLQSFNFNRAEIKAVCLSVCLTEAFKLSVAKPSTSNSDSIGRNISLKQPKAYSLGQNFKVW